MDQQTSRSTELLDLPNETLISIFEFLCFEEVAKFRIVCKRVDEICQKILNCGFQRAAQLHAVTYKRIKAMLPRRESERRNHSLARHADILTSVETRISMLSMTYSKYMDLNMCCFIPGRVLDEIFRILRLTTRTWIPLRPLEILQEFRDISSMAIEHFDEKIASDFKKTIEINRIAKISDDCEKISNDLKKTIELNTIAKLHCGGSGASSSSNCMRQISLPADNLPAIIINDYRRPSSHILKSSAMQSTVRTQRNMTMRNLHHQIKTLQRKSVQQKKHLVFFVRKVNCMTTQMAALKRRLDELDSKNQELIGTIRQYSLEDAQAEGARTSDTPETTKSKEMSPNKEKLSETQSVNDQRQKSSMVTESNVMDKPACEFKLVRKALKRHFNKAKSNNEENELINESDAKKTKI